jgi:ABC-type transport system involved in cytochrome c biogenesis permease subunit
MRVFFVLVAYLFYLNLIFCQDNIKIKSLIIAAMAMPGIGLVIAIMVWSKVLYQSQAAWNRKIMPSVLLDDIQIYKRKLIPNESNHLFNEGK